MNVLPAVFGGSTPVLPHVTWPIVPHDDESLAGFTARTCAHNALWNPAVLVADAGLRLRRGFGRLSRVSGDSSELATLLAIDQSWVEERRHRSLDERGGKAGLFVDFHGATLRKAHLDYSTIRVAPTAIVEQNYHREIWHVFTIPACTTTGELLVGTCQQPNCGKPLNWIGPKGVGRCEGSRCENAITSLRPETVPEIARPGLALAASLIHPSAETNQAALALLPPCLREENRGDLFELAWLLGCLDHPEGRKAIISPSHLSPLERSQTLARGADRLLTWPDCLTTVLRQGTEADDPDRAVTRVVETIRAIVRKPITFRRPAPLLATVLEGISTNAFTAVVGQLLGLLNAREFSRAAGLRTSKVAEIQRSNLIPRILFYEGARHIALFSPRDADDLRGRVNARLSAQSFGSQLGIGIDAVELLIAHKALSLLDDPIIQSLWPEPHLDPAIAADLRDQIVCKLSDDPAPDGSIRLWEALYGCPSGDKPWPAIIGALLTGRMTLHHGDKRKLNVRACFLSQDDLQTLQAFPISKACRVARSEWLSERDANERLSTTGKRLRSLASAGLLSPSGAYSGLTYRRSEIDAIGAAWVSTLELQAKLGQTRKELSSALRAVGLFADEHAFVPRRAAGEKLGLRLS